MECTAAIQEEAKTALAVADLVFSPQANHNFSRILTDLKRSNLSITNRLHSIQEDAYFVSEVTSAFNDRPLIANERCGSWYIAPQNKRGSAYFKSTDGHTGQWKFSTRRLNVHLLSIIGENDGCIIVDSTRRGKRMPDALSKTVPVWCCVLNRALFPNATERHRLYTPPNVVSESEHAQVEARIEGFVESLKRLDIDLEGLRGQVKRPLRPMWVTQDSQLVPTNEVFEDFHPVICCTCSRRVVGGEMSEGGYIQGAGDDTENWALGLTPPVFWEHEKELLSTPEADLRDVVLALVERHSIVSCVSATRQLTPSVFVGTLSAESPTTRTCTISILPRVTDPNTWVKTTSRMEVGLGKHKLASRNLRSALPQICDFVHNFFSSTQHNPPNAATEEGKVLILCETGKDFSIGVTLALLCQCFDDEGRNLKAGGGNDGVNKNVIKAKLGRIMTEYPEANPSRATLQSVNSFLMT
ncbi:tRNA A64-2'-O-ribosylphosphate transferase [Pseudomassariella vexata]|uniref:tRNA A64-2'-O-ribosylphosphate transferase n=1 Tax=Pseudomassariella vexata TaxID=1141098 RepID=A0A1Y2ELI4_9PEZI|nr:tRNA A64-2'-O-ribosylphosphate transferase [Pseudomassariella vexata]ORY71715.1 tRNA A64-2'-O-ribosylphosphate transferase [Pseudomassariella vexata]